MSIETYTSSQYPSSIFHILPSKNATITADCPLYVWIPGNPGLLEYYRDFLIKMHEKHPDYEILGISHAGMSTGGTVAADKDATVFNLDEQIQHKIDVINSYSSESRRLIIMGHSVGAFIAKKVITSSLLVGKVTEIGLLMPTIQDIHLSEKGITLSAIYKWLPQFPYVVASVGPILFQWMPVIMLKLLLSKFLNTDINSSAVDATEKLVTHGGFIKQALGLAKFEMETIQETSKDQVMLTEFCVQNNATLTMLFAEKDHWVSNKTRMAIIDFNNRVLGEKKFRAFITNKVTHSFVIHNSKLVVDEFL